MGFAPPPLPRSIDESLLFIYIQGPSPGNVKRWIDKSLLFIFRESCRATLRDGLKKVYY